MKRCPYCMSTLKEGEELKWCCQCGREGCNNCLPKDIDKPCKTCRIDYGEEKDEEDELQV